MLKRVRIYLELTTYRKRDEKLPKTLTIKEKELARTTGGRRDDKDIPPNFLCTLTINF